MGCDKVICGMCGTEMEIMQVSPCILCGTEIEHILRYREKLFSFDALDGEVLCDSCFSEFNGGTDPKLLGFPTSEFDVASLLVSMPWRELTPAPRPEYGYGCPKCRNSLKRQQLALSNARKYGGVLSDYYWPHVSDGSDK